MSIVGSEQWMYSSGREFYGFPIGQSLRFNSPDQPRLTRAVTHNTKTFTINFWVKRANLGRYWLYGVHSNSANTANLNFESDGTLVFYDYLSAYRFRLVTTRVFRDVGAWYCITLSVDTTQSTASDRIKMYINGVQETSFSTATYPSQNLDLKFGGGGTHAIGTEGLNNRLWWDGYLANWALIDAQALDPTSFGEFKSGIWIAKDVTGLTYGSGGYLLEFADSAAIGDDTSGNTNDWTANNLVASDVVLDSPTNNFAVLNNLDNISTTYSEGNLKISQSSYDYNSRGSFGLTSGKYYWEVRMDSTHGEFGVCENGKMPQTDPQGAYPAYFIYNNGSTGVIYNNATSVSSSSATMTNWSANDVAMIAYDADNGNLYHGLNGVWQNSADPAAGTGAIITGITSQFGGSLVPFFGSGTASARNWVVNFGQDSTFAGNETAGGNADENGLGDFAYAPPSGFLALCSSNLPSGAIDTLNDETPEDYFNTVLYSGNSTNNTPITVGFEPSMTWIKTRNVVRDHRLMDAVRGATAGIYPNLTNAEGASPLLSFDSDGFTLNNTDNYNNTGETYASWNWKAGGAGVSNTDGSITSTVSVGATSQQNWFSVVSYVGTGANATVGHGLNGTVPDLVIVKNRSIVSSFLVRSQILAANQTLLLENTTSPISTNYWQSTQPDSSVFSVSSNSEVNGSGNNLIAYCFANAEGLCKVGKYVGSAFVYTGFRPAFVLIKKASGGTFASGQSDWVLYDGIRNPSNPTDLELVPNSNQVEDTYGTGGEDIDMLSNGFKILTSSSQMTGTSTYEYIYLAIAEQPFKFANAR